MTSKMFIFIGQVPDYSNPRGGLQELFYLRDRLPMSTSLKLQHFDLCVPILALFISFQPFSKGQKIKDTEKNILEEHADDRQGKAIF